MIYLKSRYFKNISWLKYTWVLNKGVKCHQDFKRLLMTFAKMSIKLARSRFTQSKTRFLAFSIDFWTRNLVYLEATNSGILLQHRNILETILCTVVNLLLTVLLNKTKFRHFRWRRKFLTSLGSLKSFWKSLRNLGTPLAILVSFSMIRLHQIIVLNFKEFYKTYNRD